MSERIIDIPVLSCCGYQGGCYSDEFNPRHLLTEECVLLTADVVMCKNLKECEHLPYLLVTGVK